MSLTQDKALAQVFINYSDKTWGRLMSDTLIEEDVIWEVFENEDIPFIQGYVSNLANEFQFIYNEGYCAGVKDSD